MMRLTIGKFFVKDIVFGEKTRFQDGLLTINKEEAIAALNPEGKLKNVELYIAHPGDSCRMMPIKSIVKPAARLDGRAAFPGVTGPIEQAGDGLTFNLEDMAVVAVGKYGGWMEGFLDMSGPAAELTYFSQKHILAFYAETTDPLDDNGNSQKTNMAYRVGAHLLAEYCGKAAFGEEPNEWDKFNLVDVRDKKLPRVMLCTILSSFYTKEPGYNDCLYGEDVLWNIPSLMHPNEYIDGAVTSSSLIPASSHNYTYCYQEFPMLRKLYAEHGKTLDFIGVANTMIGQSVSRKDDYAIRVTQMALLNHADAVIICEQGGGNVDIDFFKTIRRLENEGIKVVGITSESPGRDGRTQSKTMLDDIADAIVSTSNNQQIMELPAMDVVIGDLKSVSRDLYPGFWFDNKDLGDSLREDGSLYCDTHSLVGHDGDLGHSYKVCKNY